jgi:hypothetical protein
MRIFIKIMASLFVLGLTYMASQFSIAVAEPKESLIFSIIFYFVISVISQIGLFLSTIDFGLKFKLLTCALMLPFTFLLIRANYDSVTRILSDNSLAPQITGIYAIGFVVYLYAYKSVVFQKQT